MARGVVQDRFLARAAHLAGRLRSKSLLFSFSYLFSVPVAIVSLLSSKGIRPDYRLTAFRKFWLGLRMFWNTVRIPSGSTYKAHLVMALKLFELPPPSVLPGDVIECGTWKGASAANLSLVCRIVERNLLVCDSFQGLPAPIDNTPDAGFYEKGDYCGTLEEVRANIARHGDIERCEFIQGWFEDTLPNIQRPIILAWVDVDLESSLETCVKNIWPRLVDEGYLFLDESVGIGYTAIFWSEWWWRKHFDRTPPGFIGAGTGLALGNYYVGPIEELDAYPHQHPGTAGYTRKTFNGYWCGPEVRRNFLEGAVHARA